MSAGPPGESATTPARTARTSAPIVAIGTSLPSPLACPDARGEDLPDIPRATSPRAAQGPGEPTMKRGTLLLLLVTLTAGCSDQLSPNPGVPLSPLRIAVLDEHGGWLPDNWAYEVNAVVRNTGESTIDGLEMDVT